jgi:hypothetical protein
VPVTDREVFEYANGRLAVHLLEDTRDLLAEDTPYADELVAMAVIRAIDQYRDAVPVATMGEIARRYRTATA